jgi:hypothetical protein
VATLSLTLRQFYTILDCRKSQFVYCHFGRVFNEHGIGEGWELSLVRRRLVANAAIFFAGSQAPEAKFGQVFFVALEELHHGQVLILNLVLPRLHVFGVIV